MKPLTRKQRTSLKQVHDRHVPNTPYLAFRRLVLNYGDYILIPVVGMWLGIELDGYTHS